MNRKLKRTMGAALGLSVLLASACAKSDHTTDTTTSTEYKYLTKGDHSGEYNSANTVSAYNTTDANNALVIDASQKVHDISDLLYGIFFEDINFAADGGLYAEMVQNRSFEFTDLASGDQKHAWSDVGAVTAEVTVNDVQGGLNGNNTNYLVISNNGEEPAGVENRGFLDGMAVSEGKTYIFSVYAKGLDGYEGSLTASIVGKDEVLASCTVEKLTGEWQQYKLSMTAGKTMDSDVRLEVTIPQGRVAVDMVSLFPQDTFHQRENGLRKDLAEKLEELQPAFLRFPGGCVVEGVNLNYAYDWKASIGVDADRNPLLFNGSYGDVAARKQGQNIWTNEAVTNDANPCYMSYGLGFYEYFLLAEDIHAVGVPVINCGLCCMAQGNGSGPETDEEEMQRYIDDALDLVEFCRGDASTTWGAVRIAMGHEEPFELKYIGIGNEQWGNSFFEHYEAFVEAFDKAKKENPKMYGDVELMFSAGPDDGDSGATLYKSAYRRAQAWLDKNPDRTVGDYAGAIDHHYYNSPDWFLSHTDYYDESNYSRNTDGMAEAVYGGAIPVFVGEYAAQSNTLRAALAEAAYMTGLEKNGDIVVMSAYAPLFGNTTAMHWAPDLIWFNNHTVTASVNYYVQKIFSNNAGSTLLASEMEGYSSTTDMAFSGKVGVGTWNTSAKFDNLLIVDNESQKTLASEDFSGDGLSEEWKKVSDGKWSVEDGMLVQASNTTNTARFGTTGTAMYFGDENWSNYTYTLEATKMDGDEGFLIPFSVGDSKNNFFWNIGGWGNTVSCLQQVQDGGKSDQLAGTSKKCVIKKGETYSLKIVVTDKNVKCYLNDKLYVDYTIPQSTYSDCYQVVSTDETGDIIMKLVNVTGNTKTFAIAINNAKITKDTAMVQQVAGDSPSNDNILGKPEQVTLKSFEVSQIADKFNYTVPPYSVTVIRIPTN